MKTILYTLLLALIILPSCKKQSCPGAVKANFSDLTGLDGCGFVIELENGKRIEPTNLSDFSVLPENGKPIWLKYHITNGASTCMVGDIVEIECISEKE